MTLADQIAALATKRIWWGHQSTGWNMIAGPTYPTVTAGVADLAAGSGLTVAQHTLGSAVPAGTFGHDLLGTNTDPVGKISSFNTRIRAYLASYAVDFAFLKLCWVDFAVTDTDAWIDGTLWPAYRDTLNALITDFPAVKFLHCTAPLMSTGDAEANVKRERYNALIRGYYPAADIFDVADLECTGKDGRRVYCAPAGTGTYYDDPTGHVRMLSDDWAQADNGHLATDGCDHMGAALIGFLHGHTATATTRMTAANRVWGVAPLAVFFDAVDVTADGSQENAFNWASATFQPTDKEGAKYAWDFGDANSGTWTQTSRSRNTASGYTTAHVYETPGVYVAQVAITDADGTVRTHEQTITVVAFSGTTYYVGTGGSDSADGLSDANRFLTVARGMTALNGGAGRRLLLRRGDTFTLTSTTITQPGPGIIDAYGTGARPIVNITTTGVEAGIEVDGQPDWRIIDLDLACATATDTSPTAIGYANDTQTRQCLVLRCRSTNFRVGMGNGDWTTIYATPHDGNAWVECEVDAPYVNGLYVGGRRIAVLGCNIHSIVTSHVLRCWQAHKGVIAHNRLWDPGPTRHSLKLHSSAYGDTRAATQWVTVSDNLCRGRVWAMAIGPQDAGVDERVAHVIVERNRFSGEASIQRDLMLWCRHAVARNNILDGTTSAAYYSPIYVGARGIEPVPDDVRIYANTLTRSDTSSEFYGVELTSTVTNVLVRNNFVSAPAGSYGANLGTGGAGCVISDNAVSRTPGFVDWAGGDMHLAVGSPAIDAGATIIAVRDDYDGSARVAPYNAGAYEAAGEVPPDPPPAGNSKLSGRARFLIR